MAQDFAYCKEEINPRLCKTDMGFGTALRYSLQMAKKDFDDPNIDHDFDDSGPLKNNLKAWREYRQMTQAQLGDAAGTAESVISLLESGKRRLSLKWLQRLAPALRTTPGYIIDHDPNDIPTDVFDLWQRVPEADRPRALDAIRLFETKDGTKR